MNKIYMIMEIFKGLTAVLIAFTVIYVVNYFLIKLENANYKKRRYKNFRDFLVCTDNYCRFTVYTDLPDDMLIEILQKKCKEMGEEVLYVECMNKMVYEREVKQEY